MAGSFKDKVANAGQAVVDAAKDAGNTIAENATQAKDWVAEKTGLASKDACDASMGKDGVKERMDVVASCGTKVGVVDHVEGSVIKLTKNDSPDGQHHYIPTSWIDHVDNHVHLKKNSVETSQGWKNDAASCSACGA